MLYDYSGFPKAAYSISWPAPGATALADRVTELLAAAGIASAKGAACAHAGNARGSLNSERPVLTCTQPDPKRGYDHGAFVPLQVAFPQADVPATQLSLLRSMSPAAHVAMGKALAPLRDEGVLIIGSGMTYHNMQGLMSCIQGGDDVSALRSKSDAFDAWLSNTLGVGAAASDATPEERLQRLQRWTDAPNGTWRCVAPCVPSR